ncbi:MAG: DsrE/DsrF/DrsH-like family protein [Gemmatimonadota bacterium]|jgi:predicted peroxiredoxin
MPSQEPTGKPGKKVALVCSNFTMQSAFGLLILALNSARLGFETLIYFTFEGLHMIRPGHLEALRYYPTGADTELAERTTEELREVMDRRDIHYPEDMLLMAQLEGVRYLACKTSADLFELEQDDFLEGVEIMLAEEFMKQAVGSDLHLVF